MDDRNHAKTWIITGAGRGIGKALVERALAVGHNVLATVRETSTLEEQEHLTIYKHDVRNRQGASEVVATAIRLYGTVDVVVNNAGYGLIGAVEEVSEEDATAILETNLLGALWLTQAAIPTMRAQGRGHIIQISTVGGVGSMPFLGLYNASKWGLEGFSEALAGEVRDFGIRVTIAEPGGVDTAWGTSSMRFSEPNRAYSEIRKAMFGTEVVPWESEPGATGGGTSPADIAAAIVQHDSAPEDARLRLLLGDDAPALVATVMKQRHDDYGIDPRFTPLQ